MSSAVHIEQERGETFKQHGNNLHTNLCSNFAPFLYGVPRINGQECSFYLPAANFVGKT